MEEGRDTEASPASTGAPDNLATMGSHLGILWLKARKEGGGSD